MCLGSAHVEVVFVDLGCARGVDELLEELHEAFVVFLAAGFEVVYVALLVFEFADEVGHMLLLSGEVVEEEGELGLQLDEVAYHLVYLVYAAL